MQDNDDMKTDAENNNRVQGENVHTPEDHSIEQDNSLPAATEDASAQIVETDPDTNERQSFAADTSADGGAGAGTTDQAQTPAGASESPVNTETLVGEQSHAEEPRSIWSEVFTWMRDLMIAAAICLLLIIYVAQPFRVEKTSMEQLLFDGDRILVSKISLLFEPINRGDIVVLWNPRDPKESWIKRVIGLPGERVQIVDGIIYINGGELTENYILEEERNPPKNSFPSRNAEWLVENYPDRMEEFGFVQMEDWETDAGTRAALRVPEGYFFVAGDHRRFSMDSRDSVYPEGESGPGVIPMKYIYGKAIFRYWPLNKIGPIPKPNY